MKSVNAKLQNNMITETGFFCTAVIGACGVGYSEYLKIKRNQITISKAICQLSK